MKFGQPLLSTRDEPTDVTVATCEIWAQTNNAAPRTRPNFKKVKNEKYVGHDGFRSSSVPALLRASTVRRSRLRTLGQRLLSLNLCSFVGLSKETLKLRNHVDREEGSELVETAEQREQVPQYCRPATTGELRNKTFDYAILPIHPPLKKTFVDSRECSVTTDHRT